MGLSLHNRFIRKCFLLVFILINLIIANSRSDNVICSIDKPDNFNLHTVQR